MAIPFSELVKDMSPERLARIHAMVKEHACVHQIFVGATQTYRQCNAAAAEGRANGWLCTKHDFQVFVNPPSRREH